MTRFDRLLRVFSIFKPSAGWYCYKISSANKIFLNHAEHGYRMCWIDGGDKVAIRGLAPAND